ncbi:smalltalk protein [Fibrobacter sp.]
MNCMNWKKVLEIAAAIIAAILGTLGVQSFVG